MSSDLHLRVARQLGREVRPEVAAYAQALAEEAGAMAALFYGSNLRTGSLEGVLDFYLLMPGRQQEKIWPKVSYNELELGGQTLRAKVAEMSLEQFSKACRGESRDTTIWARFVQPSALVWLAGEPLVDVVVEAIAQAARTAGRLAAALGPASGPAGAYWRALFKATYRAEFRVEKAGREDSILEANSDHFEGLLPLAWEADGVIFEKTPAGLVPVISTAERARILKWWRARQRLGKPLNLLRLAKATTTFEGAARYAAWKVERHTGVPIAVTPFREAYPLLSAPGALLEVLRAKRKSRSKPGDQK